MSMSKKDFELIAKAVREAKDALPIGPEWAGIMEVQDNIVYALGGAHPRFDRVRFIKACDWQAKRIG